MQDDANEPFLARWLRRKTEARARGSGASAPAGSEAGQRDRSMPQAGGRAALPALPEIDTLHGGSDFSVFMAQGVPDSVRNQALRRLWRLDPGLANLDGMNDYDQDFSTLESGVGAVRTAYDVLTGTVSRAGSDGARAEGADDASHTGVAREDMS